MAETRTLPVLPLRGMTVFPYMSIHLDVARERSMEALEQAMVGDRRILLITQRDAEVDAPEAKDLYETGTIAEVRQLIKMPGGTMRVLVEGLVRGVIEGFQALENYDEAAVTAYEDEQPSSLEMEALSRGVSHEFEEWVKLSKKIPAETLVSVAIIDDAGRLADLIASHLNLKVETKQELLSCIDIKDRMEKLYAVLAHEIELMKMEQKIGVQVRKQMEKIQKDYYLREQIKAIHKELGDKDDRTSEIEEYKKRLEEGEYPDKVRETVEKELKRLARSAVHAPESSVSQNYIEYMLELPWSVYDTSNIDINKARKVLEADHYGMEDVKKRLIEYLAVRSVASDKLKSPIICLVGPPGVGKTSIARSIASALNRKFTRMSLGGVHDEAEIRGHRKTYVGAMPGRIVSAIRQCKTMNPVFLLDEIDKMARDLRGDPASAMLEALDPAQNSTFTDHYIEAPFDLSDVLFITTANTTDTIDQALLDRMEVIEVPSYTLEEKIQIAKRHLLKKQREAHNLTVKQLKIPDKTLSALIDGYTREAGVRTLERLIGQLCRAVTLKIVEDPEVTSYTIKPADLKEYLGAPRFLRQPAAGKAEVGMVNGLAWTSVGGEVMPVEAVTFPGKGVIKLTGKLGEVMKESAELAVSVARGQLAKYGLPEDYFDKHDVHIHVPEGAVPKDGPSAGVALTCALLSAVTGLKASGEWAMTGEITLHGKVLPIGGVKEKLLAAHRMGIDRILLPRENEKDLEKIEKDILDKFEIQLMDGVTDALSRVLIPDQTEAA